MIYEWRCETCGDLVTKKSPVKYRETPPEQKCCKDHYDWKRVILTAPSVPFEGLRQSGMFMDENGNYPPRKLDGLEN